MRSVTFLFAAVLFAAVSTSQAQQNSQKPKDESMKDCPLHEQHMAAKNAASDHSHEGTSGSSPESRGNAAMGFEQAKTTHHFLLKPDGGVIQVQANDAQDTVSREQIRKHFQRIAAAFAAGDFRIPIMVHDTLPPGATTMKRLREKIQYTYEETPAGARVIIKTADPAALDAIHDFLLYQIREHETGDPQAVS
jgi:hypothetical protein